MYSSGAIDVGFVLNNIPQKKHKNERKRNRREDVEIKKKKKKKGFR